MPKMQFIREAITINQAMKDAWLKKTSIILLAKSTSEDIIVIQPQLWSVS